MWKGEILPIPQQIYKHIPFLCYLSQVLLIGVYPPGMQKNEKWHKNDMTYREKGLTISKLDMDKHFFVCFHIFHVMEKNGFLMYE